jgi:1-hydroxycarotenoid 3,4-desaturase
LAIKRIGHGKDWRVMHRSSIVVIGAGMGGLASALELAAQGHNVTVLERQSHSGGKLRTLTVAGRHIDSGPSVLTMRWVFGDLFAAVGADFAAHVSLTPLDILARHVWSDDQRLDLFADVAQSTEAIGAFSGLADAQGFADFCQQARQTYRTLKDTFITRPRPNVFTLSSRIGLHRVGALMGLRPFSTLWDALGDHFHDPRLRQLFGRYATYVGSSPFSGPATLMLIAHVEQDGVWSVDGGMQMLAQAIERLAITNGANFRFDADVREIVVDRHQVQAVILATGERIAADSVIMNGDPAALTMGLLGESCRSAVKAYDFSPKNRSLSALTWSVLATAEDWPLARHNVFFGPDYATEFDQIFRQGRLPDAPTIYVCAQDRGAPDQPVDAPTERLFILVNAPAKGDSDSFEGLEVAECQSRVFKFLNQRGLRLQAQASDCVITTPADFHRLFPATGGALYGQATHGPLASFRRPASRTQIKGLYLAGGATHPGAGLPMAALSGRLAAQRLLMDLRST